MNNKRLPKKCSIKFVSLSLPFTLLNIPFFFHRVLMIGPQISIIFNPFLLAHFFYYIVKEFCFDNQNKTPLFWQQKYFTIYCSLK